MFTSTVIIQPLKKCHRMGEENYVSQYCYF